MTRDANTGELHEARKVLLMNREVRLALCMRLAQHHTQWTWTVLREK